MWSKYIFPKLSDTFLQTLYPLNFLCVEAKIKKHTASSERELCEIGEEALWKPDSHGFIKTIETF